MSAETTSLVLAVDSTQVKSAADALGKFAQAGRDAEAHAASLEKANAKATAANVKLEDATRKLALAQEAMKAATAGAGSTQEAVAAATSKAAKAQADLTLAQLGTKTAQEGAAKAAQAHAASLASIGKQSALSASQAQQLSYQLNDFFVQVSSGQGLLTPLIQQGSQLSGTFGGIGGAMRALGSVFTLGRVAIGGAAGAIIAAGYAMKQASDEAQDFRRMLSLTNNMAGLTTDRFREMADKVAASANITKGAAREMVSGLASTGRFGSEALGAAAEAAALFGKATGKSSEDVLKSFEGMKGGVANWAAAANDNYNFLAPKMLEHIRTLEKQGRSQEAIVLTMKAFGDNARDAAEDVTALDDVLTAVKKSFDAIATGAKDGLADSLGFGALEARLRQEERKLANLKLPDRSIGAQGIFGKTQAEADAAVKAQERVVWQIKASISAEKGFADQRAKTAELNRAEAARAEVVNSTLSKQLLLRREIEAINAKFAAAKERGGDTKEIEDAQRIAIANARGRFADPSTLEEDLAKTKRDIGAFLDVFANAEDELDARRSAGLVSERDYYAAKREFIGANAALTVRMLEIENKRLSAEKVEGSSSEERDQKRLAIRRQIKENEEGIARTVRDAATKTTISGIQQSQAIEQVAAGYRAAKFAADEYLNTINKQGQRAVDDVGKSDKERARDAARNQITDKYDQQRRDLERARSELESKKDANGNSLFNGDERDKYAAQLDAINGFQDAALASWERYYEGLSSAESKWENGAARAFQNYANESQNAAKQSEQFFNKTLGGMTDALTAFAMSGKLDFKNFAQSVIRDLVRIQMQAMVTSILSAIFSPAPGATGAAGGVNGSAGGGPLTPGPGGAYAANGGDLTAGTVNVVGERGPELFVPKSAGTVIPNHKLGGTTTIIHEHVYNVEAGVSRNELISAMQLMQKSTEAKTEQRLRKAGVV